MNWSKPSTTLRSIAAEHGLAYCITPGQCACWILRVYYEDKRCEVLHRGSIGACKLAAERHLRALRTVKALLSNLFNTPSPKQGEHDAR